MDALYFAALLIFCLALIAVIYHLYFEERLHEKTTGEASQSTGATRAVRQERPVQPEQPAGADRSNLSSALRSPGLRRYCRSPMFDEPKEPNLAGIHAQRCLPLLCPDNRCLEGNQERTRTDEGFPSHEERKELT